MLLNLISFLIGTAVSVAVGTKLGAFQSISTAWVPIVLIPLASLVALVLIFVVLYLVSLCLKKQSPEKPNKLCAVVVRVVDTFLCQMARVKVHITGGELIEKHKQYLLVSNHRSNFDPMIQIYKFGRCKPIMISKPENLKMPLAGPFINASGFLAIDRTDDREALKTILKAIKFVKNYGVSVGVCPEGTRNKTGRDLLPMKAGALKIATKAKIPIVVMTFEGTENIHKNFPLRRTHVNLDVLKVITPEEYEGKSTVELCDEIARMMQKNIDLYTEKFEQCEKMSA
jgi:1-acyl-sn-glycerol-3-phosphate acyltransferase